MSLSNTMTRISAGLATALALSTPLALHAQVVTPGNVPTIVGPVAVTSTPGAGLTREYPHFTAEPYINLKRIGYLEEEFFLQGKATRYQTPSMANAVAVSSNHPYTTRIIVRRPADPSKFNGIVLVEWNNVTSGYGIDLHWQYSSEYLTREGYIHVGVQAQRVGVHQTPNGLKAWNPNRYASLDVTAGSTITDDSLSYDIFSQAVRAVKGPAREQLIGNVKPKAVFAVGQSQSAGRLTSYYNSVHPLHRVVDGFLVQVAGGPFRTDIKEPMIRVLSESEIRGNQAAIRQPDSLTFRSWEVAGAAHIDYWWVMTRHALALRDGMPPPNLACQPEPASHVPLRHVLNAGYHHLTRWVLNRVQPPVGTPIVVTSLNPTVIPRDENGLAFGGIRQHDVDAPIATNSGDQVNMTAGCPGNYGMHIPFTRERLAQLYPNKAAYVNAVQAAVARSVQEGFLLPEDADHILTEARNSAVGTGRPIPVH